jgi:hypothetical protein
VLLCWLVWSGGEERGRACTSAGRNEWLSGARVGDVGDVDTREYRVRSQNQIKESRGYE